MIFISGSYILLIFAVSLQLSYATGTPIPFFVTFSSNDNHALEIACSPTAVKVCLVRERIIGSQATKTGSSARSNNVFREVVCGASFWPVEDGCGRLVLQGELELKKALRPSFSFPGFALRVSVSTLRVPAFAHGSLLLLSFSYGNAFGVFEV